ncbi:MAG: hypothetical protein J6M16_04360 [Clostridia bacterium]|nr:hypothetical protein [Clostridia bacterium]
MEFSAPLQGELSRKLLAVYETEGLLLRLVVVLFYNPSEFYYVKPTSPYTGEARTEQEIASQTINVPTARITYHFSLIT